MTEKPATIKFILNSLKKLQKHNYYKNINSSSQYTFILDKNKTDKENFKTLLEMFSL